MNIRKKIDIKEFREKGFLQEANRQFFHPLGLALEVHIHDDGTETLSGIWDSRDDPEGLCYAYGEVDQDKVQTVRALRQSKEEGRVELFGSVLQTK